MNIYDIVSTTEKYFREFILYLLSFFYPKDSENAISETDPLLNKSIVFSLLSAIFGAYIWNIYIQDGREKFDILRYVVDKGLLWISIGILLYLIGRMLKIKLPLMSAVLCILRVVPVAHIVAIYSAYCARPIFKLFLGGHGAYEASYIAYIIEIIILFFYLPKETKAIATEYPKRGQFAGLIASVIFLFIIVVKISNNSYDNNNRLSVQTVQNSQSFIALNKVESRR
jgi:hypothetical protein